MKMFVTAVCFLFLLKFKWPKDKSIYDDTLLYLHFGKLIIVTIIIVLEVKINEVKVGLPHWYGTIQKLS